MTDETDPAKLAEIVRRVIALEHALNRVAWLSTCNVASPGQVYEALGDVARTGPPPMTRPDGGA